MKKIIYLAILLLAFSHSTSAQSVLDYQSSTGIEIQTGADVCADKIILSGTFSGGGKFCGGTPYTLTLTATIQGFYDPFANIMVSDTAKVYLRSTTSPFLRIDSSRTVLSPSGIGTFVFFNVTNGTNYYVELRHRNSIETWSSGGIAFAANVSAYNFTNAANKAFGNNQIQVDITPVRFAIYSGDVDQDGVIDGTDGAIVDNDAYEFTEGYAISDVNGDEIVDGSDGSIVENNAFNFVVKITP